MLWSLLIGLLVGLVAKAVVPGKDPGGWIVTILIGIAGAFIANLVGKNMGWYNDVEVAGFIASVLGAVFLLVMYRVISGRKRLA